jgi:hypothetical protein
MSDPTIHALIVQLRERDKEIKTLNGEIIELQTKVLALQGALKHVLCPETRETRS